MSTQLEALPYRHVLTLPMMPSAVRLARETAEQALVEWGISLRHPAIGPALLILGELVTNSVRHAAMLSPEVTVIYAALQGLSGVRRPRPPPLPAVPVRRGHRGRRSGHGHGAHQRSGRHRGRPGDADGKGKSIWISLPL